MGKLFGVVLAIIAIISGQSAGQEIGIGAILGAPFMLTTLAMVVIAVAVIVAGRGGRRSLTLRIDSGVIGQDLGTFLVMYSLAVVAGLLHVKAIDYGLAVEPWGPRTQIATAVTLALVALAVLAFVMRPRLGSIRSRIRPAAAAAGE